MEGDTTTINDNINDETTTTSNIDSSSIGSENEALTVIYDTIRLIIFEKPIIGVVVITLLYAFILQVTMMRKGPSVAEDSFTDMIDDWDKKNKSKKKSKKATTTTTTTATATRAIVDNDDDDDAPVTIEATSLDEEDENVIATEKENNINENNVNGDNNEPVVVATSNTTTSSNNKKSKKKKGKKKKKNKSGDDATVTSANTLVEEEEEIEDDGTFKIGDRIILKGFKGATRDLNRRHGVITKLRQKDQNNNRYGIDLDLVYCFTTSSKSSSDESNFTTNSAVFAKEANISIEKAIPESIEKERVKLNIDPKDTTNTNGGCLEEKHAMLCAFIFTQMRNIISNTIAKNNNAAEKLSPMQIANWGWQHWITSKDGKQGVYPSLVKFLKSDIIDRNPNLTVEKLEQQLYPKSPKGMHEFLINVIQDARAVKGWNVRLSGDFYVVGYNPHQGTYIMPHNNTRQVYAVLGYRLPLAKQFLQNLAQAKSDTTGDGETIYYIPRPPKLRLTIVPWFGRLVHDPLVSFTTGTNQIEMCPKSMSETLHASCKLAIRQKRVVSRMAQLEINADQKSSSLATSTGGLQYIPPPQPSLANIPSENLFSPPMMGPPPGGPPPHMNGNAQAAAQQQAAQQLLQQQSPITPEEREIMEQVAKLDTIPVPPQQPGQQPPQYTEETKMGMWNFVRKGPKEENPNNEGLIINATGQLIGNFTYPNSDFPQSSDILSAIQAQTLAIGKRPSMIGVDAPPPCIARLQFLFHTSTGSGKNATKVLGLNVQRGPQSGGPPPGAIRRPPPGGLGSMGIPSELLK